MRISMNERNPPVTQQKIASFESKYRLRLPEGYKVFLLETNGGVPQLTHFDLRSRPSDPIESVQFFMGIGSKWPPTGELGYAYDLYRGSLPEGVLPIAIQDLGSYICLDFRDGGGAVRFWDHRHFWSTGEWREQDLYHVANSFDEFLGMLRPDPYSSDASG